MSRTPLNTLRIRSNSTADDDDFALTQVRPLAADSGVITADTVGGLFDHVRIEGQLLWVDTNDDVLRPQPGPGTFNVQHVRVSLDDSDPVETIILGSTTQAEVGTVPFLLGDFRMGDTFGLRLTSVVSPGGGAVGYKLYWRAIPQSSGGR